MGSQHKLLVKIILVVVLALVGCSDDKEEDKDFNFNGRWRFSETITRKVGGWTPWSGELQISQSGSTVAVTFPGKSPAQGICNPATGSIQVEITTASSGYSQTCSYTGRSVGENTLQGTSRCMIPTNGDYADSSWTAELIAR